MNDKGLMKMILPGTLLNPTMFIKGFAFGKNLQQVLVSLPIARKLHDGQYRKDGDLAHMSTA